MLTDSKKLSFVGTGQTRPYPSLLPCLFLWLHALEKQVTCHVNLALWQAYLRALAHFKFNSLLNCCFLGNSSASSFRDVAFPFQTKHIDLRVNLRQAPGPGVDGVFEFKWASGAHCGARPAHFHGLGLTFFRVAIFLERDHGANAEERYFAGNPV